MDSSGEAIRELLQAVNEAEGGEEDAYGLEVSPRLGRNKAKEQYAFLYRVVQLNLTQKFRLIYYAIDICQELSTLIFIEFYSR